MPHITWHRADGSSQSFAIREDCARVGRDEANEVFIDEPLVSRYHARIERRGQQYIVVDLSSTNYTRVNGSAVHESPLNDGDELLFARARCTFSICEPAPKA
ncbi:MAG: FHA domain-containing protein [Vicinamibacteria bacterium]|nr:FHA domain-containing protein [Vicinamibacteria bacterium]